MKTFWRRFGEKRRKTWPTLSCILTMGLLTACTSGKDNPVVRQDPQRVYRATPTVEEMNQQSSTVNRKINIEAKPRSPAMKPPGERTLRVLPGRQPVVVDTVSTRRPQPDTTRQE